MSKPAYGDAAYRSGTQDKVDYKPAQATASGLILKVGGLVGVTSSDIDPTQSEMQSNPGQDALPGEDTLSISGNWDVNCAGGTVFSQGDEVGWDDSGKLAVAGPGTFRLGVCGADSPSGQEFVRVVLNHPATT